MEKTSWFPIRTSRAAKYGMLLINILSVLFPTVFIYHTTRRICNYYAARSFLDRTRAIPRHPEWMMIAVGGLVIILVSTFLLREFFTKEDKKIIFISLAVDFFVSILMMLTLQFNDNGILLWVFANIIYYVHDKVKIPFMMLGILIYVGTDYQLLLISYSLFSLSDYISVYNASMQQYLVGAYNIFRSLNIVMFIVFCIYVIQEQKGIIDKINVLYHQISEKNEALSQANIELQKLADIKEQMGKTKERNRLAREIHDTLGHTLTGISAGIDACLTMIDSQPQLTKKQLEIISKVTREGIGEVRRSVNELRPDALERLSLESAIENMITEMTQMSNAKVFFDCKVSQLKFDEDEENTIYRIVQESITNAIRHGMAEKIWVNISQEQSVLRICIKDNGKGCKELKKGFGTKHMIERINMLHGTVEFHGEDGFVVDARIPIRWGEQYD